MFQRVLPPHGFRWPAVLLVLFVSAFARTAGAEGPWSYDLGLERRHDDNVLQLTQDNLDRLASNPGPPRFLIDSASDDVTSVRGSGAWRGRVFPRRETRVFASAEANQYARNSVVNWQEYQLGAVQELTASRHSLTSLRAWVDELPAYYLGEITDADDSFAAGTRIRRSLQYAQLRYGLRVDQRLLHGVVRLALGVERVHRDYDSHFDERDNDNDQERADLDVQPFRRWGAVVRVTALVGRLHARGDLAATPIRDTDISYDHRGVGVSATLPWGRGRTRGRLEASWMPERREYTTSDKFDLNRFGRVNERREIGLAATQHVGGPFDLVVQWDRLTSEAHFPPGIVFASSATDFEQNRFGVGLRLRP